jgi:hypothetical protein
MTGVQRLFDKGYTQLHAHTRVMRSAQRLEARAAVMASVLAGITVLVLVISAITVALPYPVVGLTHGPIRAFGQPWATNDTGRVNVIFEGPVPSVSLYQDVNASVAASLAIDGILEIAPPVNGHPAVVAEALPLALAYFNGTPPANQRGPWSFSLSADLSVFSVDSALWNSSATSPPATHGPAIGVIQLVVHYLVVPGPNGTGAVAIGWTVSSWPWVSDSDYLVVEAHFVMSPTNQLLVCSRTSSLTISAPPCQGTALSPLSGAPIWNPSSASIEEDNQSGPTAAISWSSSLVTMGANGLAPRVTTGVLATSPGAGELVMGGPAHGASSVGGNITLALIGPLKALPSPAVIVGETMPYIAALAVFGGAACVGLWAYRRSDRRARDEL